VIGRTVYSIFHCLFIHTGVKLSQLVSTPHFYYKIKEKVRSGTTHKVKIYSLDFIRIGVCTKSYSFTMEEDKCLIIYPYSRLLINGESPREEYKSSVKKTG
jgi:hypothetical protein